MSNVWFTSDTHFGHKNIVRGCSDWADISNCRDFATIEEHDDYLIDQINKRVRPNDKLYHLGDFGFGVGFRERIKTLRERINCERIVLIRGNHDHLFESHCKHFEEFRLLFHRIESIYFGKIAGRFMVLCHYAMRTWPWQHHGSINLYGHSHGNLQDEANSLSLDVGVDTCIYGHEKYSPYSSEEIFHIMDNYKKFVPLDHHK